MCLGALHDAAWERFPDQLEHFKTLAPQLSHDWGSQFTSRRYGDELKTLGIRSRPTMIGCPEQNGIKERFFGALKDEEVWPKEYETRAEAIAAIDAWIDFYRTERPHQSLGYLTPAEYRAAPLGSPPEAGRPPVLFSPTGTLPAAKYALPASTGKVSGSGTGNCKPAATPKPKPKPTPKPTAKPTAKPPSSPRSQMSASTPEATPTPTPVAP